MLSALILLRHVADAAADRLTDAQSRRAWALADFLQLYNPTSLLSGPGSACAETLGPLASRLDLQSAVCPDLAPDAPKLSPVNAAVWIGARALRALPDPRRTAVVCAEGPVLAALLVAVAALDGHDLAFHSQEPADDLLPGGGWVLHRDDGLLVDVKPLGVR
ncbi:hypothetical protein GCM10009830_35970 [Glycomyces endophyticus]|uniref:Histidine phosphatase family protein n=1 Tax=Glycomyces endophyticus TaxID=480996 RepID=A0ABP4TB76_9ACTN